MKKMTNYLLAILMALIIVTMDGKNSYANDDDKNFEFSTEKTDRVIVNMEKLDTDILKAADISVLESVEQEEVISVEIPEGKSLNDYILELESMEGVKSVEPDYLIDLAYIPNDPYFSRQYYHNNIRTQKAWDRTMGSSDILVAVIDGGFDIKHPDLASQIRFSYNTVTDSTTSIRVGDHGTHVAGIIAASVDNSRHGTGVAPRTDLLLIDVFGPTTAYTSDVIEGIHLAVDQGADIINMSLGNYRYSSSLDAAIQYAHKAGVLIIAAAGNDDVDIPHYPSSFDNVISVGATDSVDDITEYTNYGNDIDLVAPGTNIQSTLPYNKFGAMTGTSMATPIVSGVAALVLANEPHLTNIEVEEILRSTTKDLGDDGKDDLYGDGLVDAALAVMPNRTERISGSSRFATAVAISKKGWSRANTVVLATANDFPDALAGGPLAYKENAPILLTRPALLAPETKAEIKRLGATKVIILGSKGAVSAEVQAELQKMNLQVERIGGKSRFDTAALIAKRLTSTEAVVANGFNFPDVLSISSYASRNSLPILLTRADSLPPETAEALQRISKTHVIGGKTAVNASVFSVLPRPIRYGGQTRYETGYEVMKKFPMGTSKAYISTGLNYPDALAGSVLAAKNNTPILLVKTGNVPAATHIQLPSYGSFSVFGGQGAVSRDVVRILNRELEN